MSDEGIEPTAEQLPPWRGPLLIVVALVVLAADVITKAVVVASLEGERPVKLLGGFAYLQLVRNPGAAFSMATGMTWVLTLIAIAVVVAIVWIMPKLRSVGWAHAGGTMPPGSFDPDPYHIYAIVMTLCYAPLLAWGPLLAAVTVQYYTRRRKGVTRQVKAPKEETTSTTFAAS